jgi:Flp pilus assembly protein TadD
MTRPLVLLALCAALALFSGCGPRPFESPSGQAIEPPGGSATPAPGPPSAPPTAQRHFHLGTASAALVTQARTQAAQGEVPLALSTLERALRIEPDNPLLWIELGAVHEGAGHYAQADSMGHKALQLAGGDPRAQASAWRLIAQSLRARDRNPEAAEAETRARGLAPQ